MNVGQKYEVSVIGKVMKKEVYPDGTIRVAIKNEETDEIAIVIEEKQKVIGWLTGTTVKT